MSVSDQLKITVFFDEISKVLCLALNQEATQGPVNSDVFLAQTNLQDQPLPL